MAYNRFWWTNLKWWIGDWLTHHTNKLIDWVATPRRKWRHPKHEFELDEEERG